MRVFRCEVCGEVYLGEEKPKNCPFCGAHEKYLKKIEDYERLRPSEVNAKSRENILDAIELEIDNAKFYACAARKTKNENEASTFKRLGKVEAEHAEALAELIDIPEKDIPTYKDCAEDAIDNYKEAHQREERAIKHYSEFAGESEEPELEEFFRALVEIERDHLELSKSKIE
ncbi:MAG: hypothetical protein KGY45_00820 [Hadesarchaea archaeon]|nr:hypothetical protein [Hadesarchaea archaeon]